MHYCCSDIHGQGDLWDRLLQELQLKEDDVLYVLGDVIDRGPDGIRILQEIMQSENMVMFLGNHELLMLDYLRGEQNSWFHEANRGDITLEAFNKLSEEEQKDLVVFLKNTWIQQYITIGSESYALHHSYFIPDRQGEDIRYPEARYDDISTAVWYSPFRKDQLYISKREYENDSYIHVVGHVPVQLIDQDRPPLYRCRGHVINIDGGCSLIPYGKQGGLYCMSLEKDENGARKEFYVQ